MRTLTQACNRFLLAVAMVTASLACASPGVPPGGPEDKAAPQIVRIAPDSGRAGITPREVIFQFDEVVSERPASAQSLDAIFLISPRDGTPNVSWHRAEVSVRPRRGWRPNTVYTITMLPGMSDLRGNARNTGAVTIFSTGTEIPKSRIAGSVFNWLTGRPTPRAFVEARTVADTSTVYVAAADSIGKFVFPNLAPNQYRVRAMLDENNNRGLDPREFWDTVTVALVDSARLEMYAFPHDSVGARLMSVGLRDSVTLELLFDHAIDVSQSITPASISIKTSDSTVVPVISVAKPVVPADTADAADTAAVRPRMSRPIPSTSLLLRISVPIRQRTTLRVRAIDIRGLDHIGASSERVVTLTPAPPPGAKASPAPPPPPPPPAAIKR